MTIHARTDSAASVAAVPRTIWSLWLQGWDRAPDIVSACRRSWEAFNPGWSFQALDRRSLTALLDDEPLMLAAAGDLPPEALSDIARIAILRRYGGVWADATTYCLRPLDAWLGDVTRTGFFAFARPAPDRMVSSWFLAAARGNVLIDAWAERTRRYWRGRTERDAYFWFHHLFVEGYEGDAAWRAVWDATPEILAAGPHAYAPYDATLWAPATAADAALVRSGEIPLLKLTHKLPAGPYPADSVIRSLCDNMRARSLRTMHVLVSWYGSFAGQGTIGDLLALRAVVTRLVGAGYDVAHASAHDVDVPGSRRVELASVAADDVSALVFVCGPVIRDHPDTSALFARFAQVWKLGVGVSLFPPDAHNAVDPFDIVLPREGGPRAYEDVAIEAPLPAIAAREDERFTVGVVLRGPQHEYAPRRAAADRTADLAFETARAIAAPRGGRVVTIENHLQGSGLPEGAIEARYAACDLVITSRFHGAMLSLRHGVPFVALDQVEGGAKVSALLTESGWPHVYAVDAIDAPELTAAAEDALAPGRRELLARVRQAAIARAQATLDRMELLLRFARPATGD